MTIRHGALLKFAEGLTREEIVAALKTIKHILDPESLTRTDYVKRPDGVAQNGGYMTPAGYEMTKRPVTNKEMVQEYNDEYGDPVWYIP